MFNYTTSDTVVDPAGHTLVLEPLVRPLAKSTAVNSFAGTHGAAASFDVTSICGLFDANK